MLHKPNFFIVGAPKCGTTALARYLSEHPAVFMSNPKEPHHYNTDLNYGAYKEWSSYLQLFESVDEKHQAVGEASVWYMYSKDAIPNILKENSSAKFIVMLRNPAEMAASLHEQMVFSGYEDVLDFQTAWGLQSEREKGRKIPFACKEKELLLYKETCSLGSQLSRVMEIVPAKNVHVILFDDFKKDLRAVWLAVQSFLGVEDDNRKQFPVVNSAKERRSLLIKRINDLYLNFRQIIGIRGLGSGLFTVLNRWNVRERQRNPLPETFRRELVAEFSDEVDRLESILGRDLSEWRQ